MFTRSIILLVFSCFISLSVHAQRVDSLKKVLESAKGVNRFDALFELAYEFVNENDSLSLVYATEAYDLALQLADTARIIKGGRIKATQLRRLENFEASIRNAEYILAIAQRHKNTFEVKILLTSLALSYTFRAEYDKALKYNFESLIIRENEGDKKGMSMSHNNIGLIYYKLQDFKRALDYYRKSLSLKDEVNDKHDLDRLFINIGLCYNAIGEYQEAEKYIKKGLNSCEGKCKEEIILEGELALGVSLLESNFTEESLVHFSRSYEVAKLIKNHRYQAENLVSLVRVYLIKADFDAVKKYLTEAEIIAREKEYRFLLVRIYDLWSKLYEKVKDYKNLSLYQSKYIKLKDSILNEKVISNLSQLRTDFEERENIKTIAEKDQVLTLQKEVIIRQQRNNFFIIAIACLIGALAYALFYFNRRQQRLNQEISSAKNKIEEQNLQLEFHNKELEENVKERTKDLYHSMEALHRVNDDLDNFIYKASHDLRGPLASMKGMSNVALMEVKDEQAVFYLQKLDAIAEKFNTVLSRLGIVNYINDSNPKPIRIDFHRILEEIISSEKRKGLPNGFTFQVTVEPNLDLKSDEVLVKLILENLIDNAIKFYNTSNQVKPYVKILVGREDIFTKVTIEDNGIGIGDRERKHIFQMFTRASERSETGGIGLYLARKATEKIGGQIALVYSTPEGSKFQLLLPDLTEVLQKRNAQEKKLIEFLEKESDPPTTTVI